MEDSFEEVPGELGWAIGVMFLIICMVIMAVPAFLLELVTAMITDTQIILWRYILWHFFLLGAGIYFGNREKGDGTKH